MHQLINNISTMSASSQISTIFVKTLKPEQSKPAEKSKEEEATYVPTIVIVKNGINNNEGGWNEVTRGNQKVTSFKKVTGTIVLAIHDQKITTSGHGNIFAKPTTTTTTDLNKKVEKKKKKKN